MGMLNTDTEQTLEKEAKGPQKRDAEDYFVSSCVSFAKKKQLITSTIISGFLRE